MSKYTVEYCKKKNGRPITDLQDFILIGQIEAESEQEAAVKAADRVGKDKVIRVRESESDQTHTIDFPDFKNLN